MNYSQVLLRIIKVSNIKEKDGLMKHIKVNDKSWKLTFINHEFSAFWMCKRCIEMLHWPRISYLRWFGLVIDNCVEQQILRAHRT